MNSAVIFGQRDSGPLRAWPRGRCREPRSEQQVNRLWYGVGPCNPISDSPGAHPELAGSAYLCQTELLQRGAQLLRGHGNAVSQSR